MPEISSRDQFNRQATHYNAEWNQWSESSLQWLLEHASAQPGERLLDVATGTGFTALAFASLVREVVGLDVAEGMLEQAQRNAAEAGIGNAVFQVGSAESIPFPDSSFDLVTCRVAPHHFDSITGFVEEAARVSVPGGRFLVADTSVPDGEPEADAWQNRAESLRDRSHVRNYSPSEWRTLLESAGFQVEVLGRCDEAKPATLELWLEKSGCQGEAAEEVRRMFAEAPASAKREFAIQPTGDGDIAFNWMRVVFLARKS